MYGDLPLHGGRKKGGRGGGLPVSIATIAASVLLLTTLWFAWGRTSYKSRWNKAERELSISTAEVYRMRADMMRHQADIAHLEERLRTARSEKDTKENDLHAVRDLLHKAQGELATAQDELHKVHAEKSSAQSALSGCADISAEATRLRADLAVAKSEVAQKALEVTQLQAAAVAHVGGGADMQRKLEEAQLAARECQLRESAAQDDVLRLRRQLVDRGIMPDKAGSQDEAHVGSLHGRDAAAAVANHAAHQQHTQHGSRHASPSHDSAHASAHGSGSHGSGSASHDSAPRHATPDEGHAQQDDAQPEHVDWEHYAEQNAEFFEHYPGFVADQHYQPDVHNGRDDTGKVRHGRLYNWLHGKRGDGSPIASGDAAAAAGHGPAGHHPAGTPPPHGGGWGAWLHGQPTDAAAAADDAQHDAAYQGKPHGWGSWLHRNPPAGGHHGGPPAWPPVGQFQGGQGTGHASGSHGWQQPAATHGQGQGQQQGQQGEHGSDGRGSGHHTAGDMQWKMGMGAQGDQHYNH